jgi:hypothetical protein
MDLDLKIANVITKIDRNRKLEKKKYVVGSKENRWREQE